MAATEFCAMTVKLTAVMLCCFPYIPDETNIWNWAALVDNGLDGSSHPCDHLFHTLGGWNSHYEVIETHKANYCNKAVFFPWWSFCLPDPDGLVPARSGALLCLQEAQVESSPADRGDKHAEGNAGNVLQGWLGLSNGWVSLNPGKVACEGIVINRDVILDTALVWIPAVWIPFSPHRGCLPAGGTTCTTSTTPSPTASARTPTSTCTLCSSAWERPSLWRSGKAELMAES